MTSPTPASNPRKERDCPPTQVPNLKLKWAFGFPGAEEVYGQPTVAGGRVFLGVDTGAVYSIDAETGCVYWSYQADAGVRTAISIGPVKGKGAAKYGVYFGDIRANVVHAGCLYRQRNLESESGRPSRCQNYGRADAL